MSYFFSHTIKDCKSTVLCIALLLMITSCSSSAVDDEIGNVRVTFLEFEKLLSRGDTIPVVSLNNVDSSFQVLSGIKMTTQEHDVVLRLRDSLIVFRAQNAHRQVLLDLEKWENNFITYSRGLAQSDEFKNIEQSLFESADFFSEYIISNGENLTEEERARINDLLAKQVAHELRVGFDKAANMAKNLLEQGSNLMNALKEEFDQ
jgi:hypothetical protein